MVNMSSLLTSLWVGQSTADLGWVKLTCSTCPQTFWTSSYMKHVLLMVPLQRQDCKCSNLSVVFTIFPVTKPSCMLKSIISETRKKHHPLVEERQKLHTKVYR